MPQAMKIRAAKAAADKEWEKLEKIPAWNKTRVRSKSEVIAEASLGKVNQKSTSNTVREQQLGWAKDSSQYRTLDAIDGEPMESEWNISQDSQHCSSSKKSKSSLEKKSANLINSTDELSSCRCSMTSYGEIRTMSRDVLLMPHLCLYLQQDSQQDVGHSSELGQELSGTPLTKKEQEEKVIESPT